MKNCHFDPNFNPKNLMNRFREEFESVPILRKRRYRQMDGQKDEDGAKFIGQIFLQEKFKHFM